MIKTGQIKITKPKTNVTTPVQTAPVKIGWTVGAVTKNLTRRSPTKILTRGWV